MKKLLLLLLISLATGYSQSFNGTVFDLDSGRIQSINGQIEKPYQPYQPQIEAYEKIISETRARTERMRQERQAMQQLYELRRQTRLLQEIADKND